MNKKNITAPLLLVLFTVYALLTGPGCNALRALMAHNRPNVIIITMDTTRADHIGCYGYDKVETPVIDRLAAEGVRFERAYSAAPITLPSHTSILTGTYTIFHGARNNGTYKVDPSITTAAEMFSPQGYSTAAFIASFPLLARFGLDQGFDIYNDNIEEGKEKKKFLFQERRAEDVNKAVFKWLDSNPKAPYFMWVHYFDPHFSYDPPPPYKNKYFFNPYDGEISYTDSQIGALLERLKSRQMLDNTVVAITADHGESMGEHNEKTHAMLIYYGTVRVPLVIWGPGIVPAGKVVGETVRTIDILPTLLDYAGVEPNRDVQGVSLRPRMEGKVKKLELTAYSETMAPYLHFNWSPLEGIRKNGYLYIKADPEELYNTMEDPKELNDLSEKEPERLVSMRKLLVKIKSGHTNPNPLDNKVKLDAQTEEKLRALGYIFGVKTKPKTGEKLQNPRFKVAILEKYFNGQSAIAAEKYDRAIEIFDHILEEEPTFGRAMLEKGLAYMKLGKLDEALKSYNEAEKYLPETSELYMGRAKIYLMMKNYEEAERELVKGIALDPDNSGAFVSMAHIKIFQKNFKAAHEFYLKAIEANYKSEVAHYELGMFYRKLGKVPESKNEFLQAKNANPDFAQGPYMLGRVLYEEGKYEEAAENFKEAIARNPKFIPAHVMLAQYYVDRDYSQKASNHLDIALALNPDYDMAHFTLGNLYVREGKLKEAFEEFNKATELNPKNALAHKNLGAIYAISGRPDKAIEHYKESLRILPNQPQAEKIKQAIADLENMMAAPKEKATPEVSPK